MKKFIALLTASVLFTSMTVCAAESVTAGAVAASTPAYASEGFSNAVDQQTAEERGMSAGEYYNNAITSAPGITNVMPVGQGGKILVNGVPTNLTATLAKADKGTVESASGQAAALGGMLLNVLKVNLPGANFNVATVNFYLRGLAGDANVVVKQLVGGVWIDVEVVEVRADHVILNLKNNGAVAFVAVP